MKEVRRTEVEVEMERWPYIYVHIRKPYQIWSNLCIVFYIAF